jgi:hypothetical protein
MNARFTAIECERNTGAAIFTIETDTQETATFRNADFDMFVRIAVKLVNPPHARITDTDQLLGAWFWLESARLVDK